MELYEAAAAPSRAFEKEEEAEEEAGLSLFGEPEPIPAALPKAATRKPFSRFVLLFGVIRR